MSLVLFQAVFSGCIGDQVGDTTSSTVTSTSTTTTTTTTTSTTTTTTTTTTTSTTLPVDWNISVTLFTDKRVYRPYELMNITVEVNSSSILEGAQIKVYGIEGLYYPYHIERSREISLEEGITVVEFSYRLPDCYGCNAISPGVYPITVEVIYEEEILATAVTEIELS